MLKELADSWNELGPRVWDFLQNSPQVNTLRVRLNEADPHRITAVLFFLLFFSSFRLGYLKGFLSSFKVKEKKKCKFLTR